MGEIIKILHGLKHAMLMVVIQVIFAGGKAKTDLDYTSSSISLCVTWSPQASPPKATSAVGRRSFVLKISAQTVSPNNCYYGCAEKSMALTSATFVSAMANLTPAITFTMAIIMGLEKLGFRTMAGRAKVLGTVIGVGGAMLLTFYKGLQINIGSTHFHLLLSHGPISSNAPSTNHHLLGALLAFTSCISYSLWLNIQAKMSENYPCYYSSTALICIIGTIQAVAFALCMEKDMSQWKLGWNIRLLTVAYSGILASGLVFSVVSWCVRMKGPLYVSVFSPLMVVLVALAGTLFLEEKLYLGSIIGAVLIVMGLYVVLWGKSKETKVVNKLVASITSPENKTIEIVVTSSLDNNTCIINNDNSVFVSKDSPMK
ncbi:hypothetical protein GOBAR_AA04654 [Gossypium barbadense]|uniref:WAT1-related protein n=1 Tax=Gossypium barbadense TaxID=3634 RepID=A0A2P5YJZ1_GOSBA|nr:hypothetical protein GOBAR_AA04654 [Gossypium barbadense]